MNEVYNVIISEEELDVLLNGNPLVKTLVVNGESKIIQIQREMHRSVKYVIDFGYGYAEFITPYKNVEKRFYILANTCFGIRKSIASFNIIRKEEIITPLFESLSFNGDKYQWREDGARKYFDPWDFKWEDWDIEFCDSCKADSDEELLLK